jgi:hypothetical protein
MDREPLHQSIAEKYLRSRIAKVTSRKLDNRTKSAVNRMFNRRGLDGNGRFKKGEHGLSKALEILSEVGIEPDGIANSHVFTRPSGRLTLDLAFTNTTDRFSPEPITNTMLVLTFHELAKYQYEVVAYLS